MLSSKAAHVPACLPGALEGSLPATLQQPSSPGPQSPFSLPPSLPVPEMLSRISGLRAKRRALLMDPSSRACSVLLTQVQGFLKLLHARSALLSSSSSRPVRNYVKGN